MSDQATFIKLLREMGHDMRVPLNTLISTSDMLAQGVYDPLTAKQEKAVTRVQRSSRRLLAMLDDFVTYMKADAGELALVSQAFNPCVLLEELVTSVRAAADGKGLTLHLTIRETMPEKLIGDEVAVRRIVAALLWNAAAHTSDGEIWVTAEWTAEHQWWLTVKDTGCGISDDVLPHIFKPFWRGEERPQFPTAGAGLGLPLSLALAKAMGGNLLLQETGTQGSSFVVQLPLQVEITP